MTLQTNHQPPSSGNKKAKFFTLEGIDGSGKTTQAKALKKELEKRGISVTIIKNPNNNQLGNFIREHIDDFGHPLKSEMFILDILVTLEYTPVKTEVVLWDRYADSIFVSNKEESLETASPLITKVPYPVKTFILDIKPEEVIKRRTIREDTLNYEWQKQKYERYQVLLKSGNKRFVRINATRYQYEITKEIADIIEKEVKGKE